MSKMASLEKGHGQGHKITNPGEVLLVEYACQK